MFFQPSKTVNNPIQLFKTSCFVSLTVRVSSILRIQQTFGGKRKGHISGSTIHRSLFIRIVASKSLHIVLAPGAWQGSAGFFNPSSFSLPKQNPCFHPLTYSPNQCMSPERKQQSIRPSVHDLLSPPSADLSLSSFNYLVPLKYA